MINSGIGYYTKAILGAFVAAAGAAITALQNGDIAVEEWIAITAAFLISGAAVWAVPNVPESVRVYGKAITAALTSGLSSAGTALLDRDITSAEWITLLMALVIGSGLVGIAPNASASDNLITYVEDEAELLDDHDGEPLNVADLPPDPYPADNGSPTYPPRVT
jgi:hypothetical protein